MCINAIQQNTVVRTVNYGARIHQCFIARAFNEHLGGQPGTSAVDTSLKYHVRRTCIGNGLFPGLAESQEGIVRSQDHRRNAVGIYSFRATDEEVERFRCSGLSLVYFSHHNP